MSIDTDELLKSKHDALRFLRVCVRDGLARSFDTAGNKWVKPYPEVTGYLLSLFCNIADDVYPINGLAERLISVQRPCGGYKSFGGGHNVFVFDTAQICMGLLDWHLSSGSDAALHACLRGAEFIRGMQLPNGAFFPIFDEKHSERISRGLSWGDTFSPINCKSTEFLTRLHDVHPESDYRAVVDSACDWTLEEPQLPYSHPGAYSLEGLIAGGRESQVRSRLQEHFLPRIEEDGFLSYHPDLPYAYVSGSVQIGLLFARVGLVEPAFRICEWARKVQRFHSCGGLFQYANADGSPNLSVHGEINSWGTKYYVELLDILAAKGVGDHQAFSD